MLFQQTMICHCNRIVSTPFHRTVIDRVDRRLKFTKQEAERKERLGLSWPLLIHTYLPNRFRGFVPNHNSFNHYHYVICT